MKRTEGDGDPSFAKQSQYMFAGDEVMVTYNNDNIVTDEMLGCAVMVFLCTCEGVEFLVDIKTINFSFSIIFFFSTFHWVLRNSRWSLCEVIDLGDNGNMATIPEKEAILEVDTTSMHKVSRVKSMTLQELIGLGKDLGYSGRELQLFLAEQQDREREEKKSEREARREEAGRETRKEEAEREARREEAERQTRREEAERQARREEAEREARREEVERQAGRDEAERQARRGEAEREARREEAVRKEN